MYVCLCKGVNDKVIQQAVMSGEVSSMRDLRQQYGVASQCGCCKNCAKDVLHQALEERSCQPHKEAQLPVSVCYT